MRNTGDESDGSQSESDDSSGQRDGTNRNEPIVISTQPSIATTNSTQAGGALKRNADGTIATPILLPPRPKKITISKVK